MFKRLLKVLIKHCSGILEGYVKRVHHDILVPKIPYQNKYLQLKEKYYHWVHKWIEDTDPRKHVFEDIAIASWLILLWEEECNATKKYVEKSFVFFFCFSYYDLFQ